MVRLCGKLGLAWGLFALTACDDTAVNAPTADILSSPGDTASGTDAIDDVSPDKAACQGSALDPAMAAFDSQCAFLSQCPHAGNCWCGDSCAANKTVCDAQYCSNAHPKCYCGTGCDASQTMCQQVVCGATPPASCEAHDDCVFNPQPPPSWCGCQTIPGHCSCGSDCQPNVALCDAKTCKNFPAKGCTANPASFTNCYCDRCGLIGQSAKCWFVLCPGAAP